MNYDSLLIEKVHQFYNDSFTHLLYLLGGVGAAIGVLFPYIANVLQSRTLARAKQELDETVKAGMALVEKGVIEKMSAYEQRIERMSGLLDDLAESLGKVQSQAEVANMHASSASGIAQLAHAEQTLAAMEYTKAAGYYLSSCASFLVAGQIDNARSVICDYKKICDNASAGSPVDKHDARGAAMRLIRLIRENYSSEFGEHLDAIKRPFGLEDY